MKLWFDLDNLPDVNVFDPLIRALGQHECMITTRRFGGLSELLSERGIRHQVVGTHQGSSTLAKGMGTGLRTVELAWSLPRFDASIASLGVPSVVAARVRGRPAIGFLDGDIPTFNLRSSAPFVSALFVPRYYDDRVLDRYGLLDRAVRYDGFKEEIAASMYRPDPTFPSRLPSRAYVLVRPEALRAEYVPKHVSSIVPAILDRLSRSNVPVVLLPRYEDDVRYADGFSNVFVPEKPVNGMDACFRAQAVLTGSGTLAREAAVLGVPAASFFPGETLLSVDREMVRRGWMLHSRDPDELLALVLNSPRRSFDQAHCQGVLRQTVELLERCLSRLVAA